VEAWRLMATARPAARAPMRGRTKFALVLLVLMAVAAVVIWRRSAGISLVEEVADMNKELISIDAERRIIERNLREAMGRQRVVSEAERRLGMHVATEGQTRTLADSGSVR